MQNITFLFITLLIGFVAVLRFLGAQHTDSLLGLYTPLGAIALFSGTLFTQRRMAITYPFIILFASDFLIMKFVYPDFSQPLLYAGWYWVYGALYLILLLGIRLGRRYQAFGNSPKLWSFRILQYSIAASLLHFLVTNFAVWLGGGLNVVTGMPYAPDFSGLLACYMLALPFLKNFFIGTLAYALALYAALEVFSRPLKRLECVDFE